jgi:hypothetical protein
LSAIETLADRPPEAEGENVAEIVQFALAASVAGLSGHVLVWAKSPAFVPVTPMLVIVNGALPEFVSVVDCPALVVPAACEPKPRLLGTRVTLGAAATPVPVNATL